MNEEIKKLVVFKGNQIRRTLHNDEWYFSIVDIIEALTESSIPKRYWTDLKKKLTKEEGFDQLYEKIVQLKLESTDGKKYTTDTANVETIFRIIQSIPSPKAEPFKKWLAKVGYERVQEIENPELAQKRMKALYKAKGYPDEWIEKRSRGIAIREELTDEWKKRGVKEGLEYAILTDEISQATFGIKTKEYKEFKALQKRDNLRDNMNDLELIFTMLGEASTTAIAKTQNAQGFKENKEAASQGGTVAGNARKELEEKTGKAITTSENYKQIAQNPQIGTEGC
ncbi:MAG: Bro-N domain-containing protein [bacterium]